MLFGADVEAAAREHAKMAYPREAAGVVARGRYVRLPNVADDPLKSFALPASAWLDHHPVEAVIHSHIAPDHGRYPSGDDMIGQISSAVPWGIVQTDGRDTTPVLWWGDHLLDAPLIGREWLHGVTDCYSAIRAWYWQERGVRLIDVARDAEWWKNSAAAGGNLFQDHFTAAGFRQVPVEEKQIGDVLLFRIRSRVANHGGVLLADGLFFHHVQGQLSRREPVGRWSPLVTHVLRHAP